MIYKQQTPMIVVPANQSPKRLFLIEMDKDSIINIAESSAYFFIFVLAFLFTSTQSKAQEHFDFAAVRNSMLTGSSWLIIIVDVAIYSRNKKLQSWIRKEVANLKSKIHPQGPIDLSNNC
jgi:hypothetical protein